MAYKVEVIMALVVKFDVGTTELRTDLGKNNVKVFCLSCDILALSP